MRDFRAKQSDEETAKRKAKDNEATNQAFAKESNEEKQKRLAANREYKAKVKDKDTKEEADAKRVQESAKRKARRHAAKAKKLALQVQNGQPPQVPRQSPIPSTSKGLVGFPHLCDETPPTLVRKRKPIDFTMDDLEAEKSDEDSDGFVASVSPAERRRMPKRKCTSQNTNESDDEFDNYVDDLVDSATKNIPNDEIDKNETHQIMRLIVDSMLKSAVKIKSKGSRKFFVGRKSKRATKSAKYREKEETEVQYGNRLKRSSDLKHQKLKEELSSDRKRRLFRLQQARYVKIENVM